MDYAMTIDADLWANHLDRQLIPVDTRVRRKAHSGFAGAQTGLPVNEWLEKAFQWNELNSMAYFVNREDHFMLDDDQIKANFIQEFGKLARRKKGNHKGVKPGNSVISGKHSISFKRTLYRKGTLYANQTRPFLTPLRYMQNRIVSDSSRRRPKFLDLTECKTLCIQYKIADPRFFTVDELERLHQSVIQQGTVSDWRFPTQAELSNLAKMIPVIPYRSVLTYDLQKDGKSKEPKPVKKPIEEVNKIKKRINKNDEEELERQRQTTLSFIESVTPDSED